MGKYFTIDELCRSITARERHINNEPTPEAVANMEALIASVLDPIRELYGKPIKVSSGYRCPELNRLVGGVKKSQHVFGEAADIKGEDSMENYRIGCLIAKNCPFDQLIFEQVMHDNLYPQWIHVSFRATGKNRGEILKTTLGHNVYEKVVL